MSLSRNLSSSGINYNSGGYEWYQCNCCPYGYHIDLDFVQYCESVGQSVERTASMKRRKDRRRQRQSMDVLLGLIPPLLDCIEQNHSTIQECEPLKVTPTKPDVNKCLLIEDTMLNDAVNDFERTLLRSKNTLSNNLPDVTAVFDNTRSASVSTASLASGSSMTVLRTGVDDTIARDFDTVSVESSCLSPMALHAIREQMAISLERMKQLEEQVKILPTLQGQITLLKTEKLQLQQQLQKEENGRLNSINANYLDSSNLRPKSRSLSFTNIDSLPRKNMSHRDFGVTCSVLTRNVGVGHQYPNTRTVSTETLAEQKEMKSELVDLRKVISAVRGTQTLMLRDSKKVQTVDVTPSKKAVVDSYTQTLQLKNSIGVMALPETSSSNIQVTPETRTVAVSEDKISDLLCLNCRINKKDIPSTKKDCGTNTDETREISLLSLSLPLTRKHFEETASTRVTGRSIGCQHVYNGVDKSIQYKSKLATKASQHEVRLAHKLTQYDWVVNSTKHTDTVDLDPQLVHTGCGADIVGTSEAATNTLETETCAKCSSKENVESFEASTNTVDIETCVKCLSKEKERDSTPTTSRIPRLQAPGTPVESRKYVRQDTYTKVPASVGLSAFQIQAKTMKQNSTEHNQDNANVKQKCEMKPAEVPAPLEEDDVPETLTPVNESGLAERKKATPTKEMQAAMKVLNDSLQKRQRKNLETQLKSALSIIQQEWFKISSTITAKPLDVEDYLDCFEELSSALLEYIVNMVDASGNTAMHYAVSHGNFDVVSILLDSKVCDINKQNKAGYTCVMLVSLAEVRSQTHATVVRRLFSMADVNIRAKQHAQTALMLAVSHGRLDMVRMLLEAGADINIQDEDGSTALMCAAEHGHVDIVKHFLSQADCDSSICDVDGSTALKIAMEAGHRHIGVLLYAHERNLQTSTKHKRSKSASASPRTPSSPLPVRNITRPAPSNK